MNPKKKKFPPPAAPVPTPPKTVTPTNTAPKDAPAVTDVKTSPATTDPTPASSDTTIPPVTTAPVTPPVKSDSSITSVPAPTTPPATQTPTPQPKTPIDTSPTKNIPVSTHYIPKLIAKLSSLFSFKTAHAAGFSNISASVLDLAGNTTDISAVVEPVVVIGLEQHQVG